MCENRETSYPPSGQNRGTRREGLGQEPAMNGYEESDRPIVLTKSPNNPGGLGTEEMEGRGLVKENTGQQNTRWTQSRVSVPSALDRVRIVATEERLAAIIRDKSRMR